MTYAIALRLFAVMLALLCIGLMSLIAHHTHVRQADPSMPHLAIRFDDTPRWPETVLRGGMISLLVSFVFLTVTCLLIAGI
ncbi:hypothetical protein B0G62_12656 [Paraburkholderia eburnea]|uniref:Uncharacterized protein n=1 Tax=Paraburkholderia eburnea TaxID=1189126 RepID=A0A2S4LUS2_9BURK|nr:hypothetical protein [Paraburkholderia eburnea]POR46207.1 hypothetical protein B0G62_12656 [Paraburkholderia eburnea]PRZ25926.1 hypothetical protein BX588_102543 [Paraburkholderia eburnea]